MPVFSLALAAAFAATSPLTVPEQTRYQRTSTTAEVKAFFDDLAKRNPALRPYRPKGAPERDEGGAPFLAWRLPAASKEAVRVYVQGNIHGGEVEGKEALQLFARELLEGRHPLLRRHLDIVLVPAYNADGTDALDPAIRTWQPNPESGVGRRETLRGLDLNRDLMKVRGAATRFHLAVLRDFDPVLVMDLHTTDGSYHGFHLTYTPALTIGGDPELLALNRRLLGEVRERLLAEGVRTYDYGDFEPDEPGRKGGTPERWGTVNPLPRYLVNYQGLRHRLAILSECYVYPSFPERVETTRRFVVASLGWVAEHRDEVRAEVRTAEERWQAAWRDGSPTLPLGFEPIAAETRPFDVITPLRDELRRVVGEKARVTLELPAFTAFKPLDEVSLGAGYLVDPLFAAEIRPILEAHGIRVLAGSARPRQLQVLHFQETGRQVGDVFQGVFPITLRGIWTAAPASKPSTLSWRDTDLDRALFVPLDQPLGRVAFYLLDPRSPDGLIHWGLFHSVLLRGRGMWGEPPRFPILLLARDSSMPESGARPAARERQE